MCSDDACGACRVNGPTSWHVFDDPKRSKNLSRFCNSCGHVSCSNGHALNYDDSGPDGREW